MSSDPAWFVAGVPVKISERFRPPRRITLPPACTHSINPHLLTQEYDFSVENTTLKWVQERIARREKEQADRKARIAEYDQKKADKKAAEEEAKRLKKEEQERLQKEEEEKLRILKEEEEKRRKEEEERALQEEEKRKEEEKEKGEKEGAEEENPEENGAAPEESDAPEGTETPPEPQSPDAQPDANGIVRPGAHQGIQRIQAPQGGQGVQGVQGMQSSQGSMVFQGNGQVYKSPSVEKDTGLLQPTPIPQNNNHRSPHKTLANINFAEFEGEGNDPFDSAALKSINDMEELAKVLGSSSLGMAGSPGVTKQGSEDNTVPTTYPNGQVTYNAYGQYPYYMQQQQQQQQQQNLAGGQNQYNSAMGKGGPITTSSSPAVPSYANGSHYVPGRSFQNNYYAQWSNNYNSGSPSKGAQFGSYNYHAANTAAPVTSHAATSHAATVTAPSTVSAGLNTNPSGGGGSVGKRQDLEDFYSRYYSNNKSVASPQSGARSGDSTPSHSSGSNPGEATGSLRSCRSVPDLTAAEDSEVTTYSSRVAAGGDTRGYSHTPPPRPSSTGITGLEDWKPLPDLGGSPDGTKPHSRTSPLAAPPKARLPDPFTELTPDAQALVRSMAEMGFPRPRVARAVQKLGTDHKKLIEVLLTLQGLQERGEDEYRAERAFYHYMGDLDKTTDHLAAVKQLCDLGFEDERIVDALLKHNNDRDKALEELIA